MKTGFLVLIILLFLVGVVYPATLNLKATWNAVTINADGTSCTDLSKYRVYRTDGVRTKVCEVNQPILTCLFSITVSDDATGTMTFVATALDLTGNESVDSNVVSYPGIQWWLHQCPGL